MGTGTQSKRTKRHMVTGAKLRGLLRYAAKQKKVRIGYIYDNSLGWHDHRIYEGKLNDFTVTAECIEEDKGKHSPYEYDIRFTIDGKRHQEYVPPDASFQSFGSLRWSNSGPWCHFYVKILEWRKKVSV